MSRTSADPSASLAERAAAVLRSKFPCHIPGERDGWLILPRNGRWIAVWDLADQERETPERAAKRLELAQALAAAGYVVTLPSNAYMVFFADRPHDDSGPRYTVVRGDTVLGGLFGGPYLVMDTWTRVDISAHRSEAEANARCAEISREQALADAKANSARGMDVFLTEADQLLGDGDWFLRTEEHRVNDHRPPTVHERIDALVDLANAVRRGDDIEQTGRRVVYGQASVEYDVAWCAKSSTPAVGWFPGFEGDRERPHVQEAIRLLVDAGLTPVVYGEPIGTRSYQVEQDGFMVSAGDKMPEHRVALSIIGRSAEQHPRVVEVLRSAGWSVHSDRADDLFHEASPPAE
ncbi:hypothetical protein ACFYZ9_33625 [Streptomyces sp. NPDC001691]|uniref:hypothetical protein n=1 Tax=Streptomyces sp. NPDC001691 TaxID=3364600 RepID=UPI003687A8AB